MDAQISGLGEQGPSIVQAVEARVDFVNLVLIVSFVSSELKSRMLVSPSAPFSVASIIVPSTTSVTDNFILCLIEPIMLQGPNELDGKLRTR